jgi:3-oxoacyl-(acyl-carrier-protein) synthase
MVSPIGLNVTESWENAIKGKSGIVSIKELAPYKEDNRYPDCYAAPVPTNFDRRKWAVQVSAFRMRSTFELIAKDHKQSYKQPCRRCDIRGTTRCE